MMKKIKDKMVFIVVSFFMLLKHLTVSTYKIVEHILACLSMYVRLEVWRHIKAFIVGIFK